MSSCNAYCGIDGWVAWCDNCELCLGCTRHGPARPECGFCERTEPMTTIKIAKVTWIRKDFGEVLSKESMWGMSVNDSPWMFTSSKGMWDFLAAAAECPKQIQIQCVAPFTQVRELNPKGAI